MKSKKKIKIEADSQNRMNKAAEEHEYSERCANDNSAYFSASNSFKKGWKAHYTDLKQLLGLKDDAKLEDVLLNLIREARYFTGQVWLADKTLGKFSARKHADLIDAVLAPFKEK